MIRQGLKILAWILFIIECVLLVSLPGIPSWLLLVVLLLAGFAFRTWLVALSVGLVFLVLWYEYLSFTQFIMSIAGFIVFAFAIEAFRRYVMIPNDSGSIV